MGRGLALAALPGVLAVLSSCAGEDAAEPTSTATWPASSATPSPTSASATPTPTAALDQYGCDAGPDGEKCRLLATHTPIPTPTVAPASAAYPTGTRTGVPEVDAVIDAVERKDAAGLAELVQFLTYPCEDAKPIQPHALRCREGQRPGDALRGIWVTHVEGGLWPFEADGDRSRLAMMFEGVFGWWTGQLHAVYHYQGNEQGWDQLRPKYVVTFTSWDAVQGTRFDNIVLGERGVVEIAFAFPPLEPPIWDDPSHPGWLVPRAQ